MTKISEQAKAETERLDKERQERMQGAGMNPFFSFADGDSAVLSFVDGEIREYEGKYGKRKVFTVQDEQGTTYDFSVNPRSPLYRAIVSNIAAEKLRMQITRVGEGIDTQYSVKVV